MQADKGGPSSEKQESYIKSSFKRDIAQAKDTLSELLKMAAVLLQENTIQSGSQKESQYRMKMEKGLTKLFALLDQIEANLKLAAMWYGQTMDSKKHVGIPVAGRKTDEVQATTCIPLQDYMKVVKIQISAAKDLHDFITDTENKLSQVSVPPTPTTIQTPGGQ